MGGGRVYIETGRRLRYVGEEGKTDVPQLVLSYRCLKVLPYNAETRPACDTEFVVIAVRNNTALQAAFLSSSARMVFILELNIFKLYS
jgi:hypothetical protein